MHPKDKVTEEENSKTRRIEIKLSAHRSKSLREDDKANCIQRAGSLIGVKTVNWMLWV